MHAEDDNLFEVDHIYVDAMGFGAGCCCLQVTIQAASMKEARFLYDQLVPMAPILVSLSCFCEMKSSKSGFLLFSSLLSALLRQYGGDI